MSSSPRLALCLAAALSACATARVDTPTLRTERHLASIRADGARTAAFLRAMPKGGDLHLHLSGAVYAESYLRWAVDDGLCVQREPLGLVEAPCDPARALPAADALREPRMYDRLVDAFSMRNHDPALGSGHDRFFATFDAFEAAPHRTGDSLAEVVSRLARQNTWYVEVMQSLGTGSASRLLRGVAWDGDLAAMAARVPEAELSRAATEATARIDRQEARVRELLRCGTPAEDPGCRVTVRYVVSLFRNQSREELLAATMAAARGARSAPRVVALNLVAPQDHPITRRDYDDQMRIVAHATDAGRAVNVTLHAGELTPSLVPPEDTRSHIRGAVMVAGARRIGHGTDLAWEDDVWALLAEMARRRVAVEVCVSSAEGILGVGPDEHPFGMYRAAGVPVTLATDDEGVSRSDLTREYLRAARAWDLSWRDLRELARAAVQHSFLEGATVEGRAECDGDVPGDPHTSARCEAFLATSPRAREEWRLEAALRAFERRW